jgi:hypothetical protein
VVEEAKPSYLEYEYKKLIISGMKSLSGSNIKKMF